MKKIEAIVRKSRFTEVKQALHEAGIDFFTYWDVTGIGHEKQEHVYRGVAYNANDIQRVYLSIVLNDDFEERTIEALLRTAHTGQVGDGKIFVSPVEESYRIRTKEKGAQALK